VGRPEHGKFKDKARQFLKAHESTCVAAAPAAQPAADAHRPGTELERMLVEAGGTQELIEEAKEQSQGLGIFIRSLVGLEREAAMQAFSEFITGTTATPDQIEFIDLVVQELTENGVMEPRGCYQSPFR
jgi:type I restriction enzyme R subunit